MSLVKTKYSSLTIFFNGFNILLRLVDNGISLIDSLVLGCTHYPLLKEKIQTFLPEGITVFAQGEYVAESLVDYLHRHPEMDKRLTKQGKCRFLTTESATKFSEVASVFLSHPIEVEQIAID